MFGMAVILAKTKKSEQGMSLIELMIITSFTVTALIAIFNGVHRAIKVGKAAQLAHNSHTVISKIHGYLRNQESCERLNFILDGNTVVRPTVASLGALGTYQPILRSLNQVTYTQANGNVIVLIDSTEYADLGIAGIHIEQHSFALEAGANPLYLLRMRFEQDNTLMKQQVAKHKEWVVKQTGFLAVVNAGTNVVTSCYADITYRHYCERLGGVYDPNAAGVQCSGLP